MIAPAAKAPAASLAMIFVAWRRLRGLSADSARRLFVWLKAAISSCGKAAKGGFFVWYLICRNRRSQCWALWGWNMKDSDLAKMPLDDLWRLHEQISQLLDRKLQQEARRLQRRLVELAHKFGGAASDIPQLPPYTKVEPTFRNPKDPSESGRATQTATLGNELLAAGRDLRRI